MLAGGRHRRPTAPRSPHTLQPPPPTLSLVVQVIRSSLRPSDFGTYRYLEFSPPDERGFATLSWEMTFPGSSSSDLKWSLQTCWVGGGVDWPRVGKKVPGLNVFFTPMSNPVSEFWAHSLPLPSLCTSFWRKI